MRPWRGVAWAAVQAVARREVRRGWTGLVALGLLAGLAGAVATGAMVVERRTATAEERLRAAMGVEDLRVYAIGGPVPDAAGIPGIERSWNPAIVVGRVEGTAALNYMAVVAGPPHPGIFEPVVVQGRAVNPESIDEVQVAEDGAVQFGIRVGQTITLKLLAAEQADDWNTGIGEPRGPTVRLRVVGLTRITPKSSGGVGIMSSPAFAERYGKDAQGGALMLQTRPGVPVESVVRELNARAGDSPVQFEFPSREAAPVRTAAHILTGGALAFLVVAAVAGTVALAQVTSRHHTAGAPTQDVERVLGLTAGERVLGHAVPSLLSAGVAALVTAAGGVAAGWVEPLGSLRTSEPAPGFRLNPGVVLAGAALAALVVLLISAVAAARATGARTSPGNPRRSLRLGRSAVSSAGTRLALGGRGAARLLTGAAGVAVAVAGMLASLTVAGSLQRMVDAPPSYGVTADLSVADARPELLDRLRPDPRVTALTFTKAGRTRLDGRDVVSYSQEFVTGRLTWTMIEGRPPEDDVEIALGAKLARTLDVVTGDRLQVETPRGPDELTVSGVGVGPYNGEAFGDNALLTPGGMQSTSRTDPFFTLDVKLVPGADVQQFVGELAGDWEVLVPERPPEVSSLDELGRLPLYLAAFFVVAGLGALGHSTLLLVRRNARELAVLHTIGFTRAQVAGSLLLSTVVTTLAGLLVGIPLGLALGRVVWYSVAQGVGVVPDVRLPLLAAALTVPAALLLAVLVSVAPTWRATRLPLQHALRTE